MTNEFEVNNKDQNEKLDFAKLCKKIQKTIVELQEIKIEKSGKNSFAKFDYFELKDFLPHLNKLLNSNGLFCKFEIRETNASLLVCDSDSGAFTEFFCPTAAVQMKGVQEIQNLGAQQTYVRRYLYVLAFAISENDVLDSICGNNKHDQTIKKRFEEQKTIPQKDFSQNEDTIINSEKRKALIDFAEKENVPISKMQEILLNYGYMRSAFVCEKDYNFIIEDIKKIKNGTTNK